MAEPKITNETINTISKIKIEISEIDKAIDEGDWDIMSDHIFQLCILTTGLYKNH